MSIKRHLSSVLSNAKSNAKRYAKRTIAEIGRNERNVDIYLRSILQDKKVLLNVNDAASYIDLLRACIEPTALRVETVKSSNSLGDVYGHRFKTLIETIQSNLLPLPVPMALELAEEADCLRGMTVGIDWENLWSGDVGLHFGMASSLGHKGRLLSSVIRLCRSERCLELGTAYGMSAMFVLGMQPFLGWRINLTTVEFSEPQFTLVSQRLKQRYQDVINCHFGSTKDLLPKLMSTLGPIDYVFHDAGHTREDYVRDFGAVVNSLSSGSVMVIDDISYAGDPVRREVANPYPGWLEVVAHARIRHAVEVDGAIGVALLS
jgi:predicted O-methyltransferase YrrM